jgi:hypothetical protein
VTVTFPCHISKKVNIKGKTKLSTLQRNILKKIAWDKTKYCYILGGKSLFTLNLLTNYIDFSCLSLVMTPTYKKELNAIKKKA